VNQPLDLEQEAALRPRPFYEMSKRLFDVVFSLFGIVVLWPVMLLIALAVKLDSRGPIIYKGMRSGRNGNPFKILKFRSMVVGAETGAGTTSRNDARVTAVGRIIRSTKMDELPQLFNVLIGNMSFVGPRPELPRYTKKYSGKERLILSVPPGITDFSSIQFSNLNNMICDSDPDRSFEENVLAKKNQLRVYYVENRSFMVDLILILKTILRVLKV
jgi:lipopolysaccharide/colanic/teichoic acid biosynthesis glycosyltransferase